MASTRLPHLLSVTFCAAFIVAAGSLGLNGQAWAQPRRSDHMSPMDHGPFASSTISADPLSARAILVYKGVAVKVGSERDAVMAFDTDLLRVASAWTGGLLEWYPARDGLQEWPTPDGFIHLSTGQRPGWSRNKNFTDPRPQPYGPVPAALGKYQGLHLNGDNVVFSYTIAECQFLELPGFARIQDRPIFTRTFNLGPTRESLSLHVLQTPDGPATSLVPELRSATEGYQRIQSRDESRVVGFQGVPRGSTWRLANQHLILDLPPLEQPLRFRIAMGPVLPGKESDYMLTYLGQASEVPDLAQFQQPGPARWEVLETQAVTGDNSGPFAVDELTLPTPNPWRSLSVCRRSTSCRMAGR